MVYRRMRRQKGKMMRTVHEVSELTGVSIRTLQHYDNIGLLRPADRTAAGYRLYSDDDLARLQHILLFRELEFPLKDIKRIIDSPGFDQSRALDQQIELLELKRAHIANLIGLARSMRAKGASTMAFEAFDTSKMDEYAAQAKASWGETPEWKEYERKSAGRTKEDERTMGDELLSLVKLVKGNLDTRFAGRRIGLVAIDNDELERRWRSAIFEFTFDTHPLAILKGY